MRLFKIMQPSQRKDAPAGTAPTPPNFQRNRIIRKKTPEKKDLEVQFPRSTANLVADGTLPDVAPWIVGMNESGPAENLPVTGTSSKSHLPDTAPATPSKDPVPPPKDSVPSITLLVGKQDPSSRYLTPHVFQLPVSVLHRSKLLAKHYDNAQRSATSLHVRLPSLDPNAFELYHQYVSTGSFRLPERIGLVESPKWAWAGCWPLINAHILATTLWDPHFANYVMRILQGKLKNKQRADPDTIRHVFTVPDVSEPLKQLIVDKAIEGGIENFEPGLLALYPTPFIHLALRTLLEDSTPSPRSKVSVERASSTGSVRWCLRRHPPDVKTEVMWQMKERLRSTMDTRDSQEEKNRTEANGVKTIDWASRRDAEQNEMRALAAAQRDLSARLEASATEVHEVDTTKEKIVVEDVAESDTPLNNREGTAPLLAVTRQQEEPARGPHESKSEETVQDDPTQQVEAPAVISDMDKPVKTIGMSLSVKRNSRPTSTSNHSGLTLVDVYEGPWKSPMPGSYPESVIGYT